MTTNRSLLGRPASWLAGGLLAIAAALLGGCDHRERAIHYDHYYGDAMPPPPRAVVVVRRPAFHPRPPIVMRGHQRPGHDGGRRGHH